ncbi:hypothetical protein BIWAKO_05637 [Bosea sp. BIWAKO-01]|nr:hypothetical protein BIWAKO_05637 [Bosea sp. BIWAKO-01]
MEAERSAQELLRRLREADRGGPSGPTHEVLFFGDLVGRLSSKRRAALKASPRGRTDGLAKPAVR